jgi:hypothetical protein
MVLAVRRVRRIGAVPEMVAVTALVRISAAGLGVVSGVTIVLTPSAARGAPLWPVWASLAVALTSTAGAVFCYGLARWADLSAVRPVRVQDVVIPVAGLLAVAALAGLAVLALTVMAHRAGTGWSAFRGWALVSVALFGAVPAVAVMCGICHVAGGGAAAGTRGEQAGELMALRRLLQRLLAAVGSLVALSTLALGAAFALQQSLPARSAHSQAAQLAPQTVLVFGGVGSALVAAAYGPASTALKAWAQRVCDELFPLHQADEAAVILNQAEGRSKLEQLLGADRSVAADLQTGLAILGPLIASAATAFLPH